MLLTVARRTARTGPDGGLIPLAEYDRTRWARIAERARPATADPTVRMPDTVHGCRTPALLLIT
ncbi:DUF6596 domain-containing protein [Streptomyces erythrochromogenes]|uniref:DUF6596 domain-containing protein n=1 Tax=Streptomyces erythrochromogenes TaxID=285574 RepID=UPI003F4DAB80